VASTFVHAPPASVCTCGEPSTVFAAQAVSVNAASTIEAVFLTNGMLPP
jgi:hypothetical protein